MADLLRRALALVDRSALQLRAATFRGEDASSARAKLFEASALLGDAIRRVDNIDNGTSQHYRWRGSPPLPEGAAE